MIRAVLLATLLFALTAGCSLAPKKHYPLPAEVISTLPQRGLLIVKHDEIPGLMPAMTMQYEVVDPKQIDDLKPGDRITAALVVSDAKGRLEKISLVSRGQGKPPRNPG